MVLLWGPYFGVELFHDGEGTLGPDSFAWGVLDLSDVDCSMHTRHPSLFLNLLHL
jgi:hypothetical protein